MKTKYRSRVTRDAQRNRLAVRKHYLERRIKAVKQGKAERIYYPLGQLRRELKYVTDTLKWLSGSKHGHQNSHKSTRSNGRVRPQASTA